MGFVNYLQEISNTTRSLWKGLRLTARHARWRTSSPVPQAVANPSYFAPSKGSTVTIDYPRQALPLPDTGRYRLFTEIEDCIGCDKCSRICPVDCITIDKVRAVDDLGLTSDGSKKNFYFPTFDIDMAKCMYCGLCTVVCPTECIIMTKNYDYSTFDRGELVFHFGNLSPEAAAEKQAEFERVEAERKAAKAAALAAAAQAKAQAANPAS